MFELVSVNEIEVPVAVSGTVSSRASQLTAKARM